MEAVQDFLAIGRDVNEQDEGGRSPLHYAVAYAHDDVAAELLEAGASLAAQVCSPRCVTRKGPDTGAYSCQKPACVDGETREVGHKKGRQDQGSGLA